MPAAFDGDARWPRPADGRATGALVASQQQGVLLGFDLAQLPFYLELGALSDW